MGSALTQAGLQDVVDRAREAYALPGVSVAVLSDGEVTTAASGVINLVTGVETTTDTLFQIGSITKMYTATMIMQLVDAGSVELDAPIVGYIPDFRVADERATATITARQLLTHSAGFDGGDWFFLGGRGDDSLAKYVASLTGLKQIAPQGEYWSYNNAGYGVLGRIIEVVTGQTWEDATRDLLLKPAGLDHTVAFPEDALLFRTAAGHVMADDGTVQRVSEWGMDRSTGAFGALCASAEDVIGFARIHIDDGTGVLSAASLKAMQEPHVAFLGQDDAHSGLGWHLENRGGLRTVGHGGDTPGQHAQLLIAPDRGFAIAHLTNGPTGQLVYLDVLEYVTSTLGLPSQKPPAPQVPDPAPSFDPAKFVGVYERNAVRHHVTEEADGLQLRLEYVDVPYDLAPPPPWPLTPLAPPRFAVVGPDGGVMLTIEFLDFADDGRAQLIFASRLARRV